MRAEIYEGLARLKLGDNKEKRIVSTSKKARKIVVTSKRYPKVDLDWVGRALGAEGYEKLPVDGLNAVEPKIDVGLGEGLAPKEPTEGGEG